MKKLVTVLLTLFLLTGCGHELPSTAAVTTATALPEATAPTVPPAPTQPEEAFDHTRPAYDHGTCRALTGNPQVVLFYLSDENSSWNHESIENFYHDHISKGLQFLQEQAAQWDVALNLTANTYQNILYPGTVEPDYLTHGESKDILAQIASAMGYSSEEEMHRHMTQTYRTQHIIYLILVNKEGRSYSLQDTVADNLNTIEYSVIFNGYPGAQLQATPATIAHEMLHLFGAEDYYDPFGNQPARKALAAQYFPDDIMLCTYTDVTSNMIGEVTAYSVGWLDSPPELVKNELWWQ